MMRRRYQPLIRPILVLSIVFCGASAVRAQQSDEPPPKFENEVDRFMYEALKRREIDWDRLHGYIFDEKEVLEIKGPKAAALESFRREYVWFVRDGYLVRSPVRINGVKVSKEEQSAAEEKWIRRQKKKKSRNSLDREAFFGFKFEPGRYLFAGEKTFEGRKVVSVDFYPRMTDEEEQGKEDEIDRKLEKAFLVNMLIVPEEHQVVRIRLDNVGFDFLPYRWLVRLDELYAVMTMDKPFGDVWLPREIRASGSVSTAPMTLSVKYSREFYNYSKTDVRVKFWYETPSPEPKP